MYNTGSPAQHSDDLEGWDGEGCEGGDIYIYIYIIMADLHCTAETNTTL